ncbi:MAG: hypothetical protein DA330_09010 [Nitrososphaera sp.]|nr:hypothetical protein [Nitrososphaera sp.]
MSMKSFTRGFEDKSDAGGFRFVFKCDICNAEFASRYVEASSNKKRDTIGITSKAFSLGKSILDVIPTNKPDLKDIDEKQADFSKTLSDRFKSYSPEWHKGHDDAFFLAQEEAKTYFRNCTICKKWVCEADWDEDKAVCREDSKLEVCSNCHKPTGGKKFCVYCGQSLALVCKSCGASLSQGQKFCGECGTKQD